MSKDVWTVVREHLANIDIPEGWTISVEKEEVPGLITSNYILSMNKYGGATYTHDIKNLASYTIIRGVENLIELMMHDEREKQVKNGPVVIHNG